MPSITLNTSSLPHDDSIELDMHLVATLKITAEEARRTVNQQYVLELGTGLAAGTPELFVQNEQIFWRVPIRMSLPKLGDLGQVGSVRVDAQTGEIVASAAEKDAIIQHSSRLYAGSTLSTE